MPKIYKLFSDENLISYRVKRFLTNFITNIAIVLHYCYCIIQ